MATIDQILSNALSLGGGGGSDPLSHVVGFKPDIENRVVKVQNGNILAALREASYLPASADKYTSRFSQYFNTASQKLGEGFSSIQMISDTDNTNWQNMTAGPVYLATTSSGKKYVIEVPHSPGGGMLDWQTSPKDGWIGLGLGDLGGEGNEELGYAAGGSMIPLNQFRGFGPGAAVVLDNINPSGASGLGSIGGLLGAGIGLATGMPWLGSAIGALSDGKLSGGDLLGLGISGFSTLGGMEGLFGGAEGLGGLELLGDAGGYNWSSLEGLGGLTELGGAGGSMFDFDFGSALDALQSGVSDGSIALDDAMTAVSALNNFSSGGSWGDLALNAGSAGMFDDWGIASQLGGDAWNEAANKLFENAGMPGYDQYGSKSDWVSNLYQQAVNDPIGIAAKAYRALQSSGLLSGGLSAVGGVLAGNAAQDAAKTSAQAQIEAARIAADAAKFKPVGVTTRFGKSQFTKDAQGNVVSAGYNVSPDIKAMQDSLIGIAPGMLSQFTGSQAATAPMGVGAQRAMSLGNQYLNTDPMAQAKKYYDDQQAIMATGRARDQAGALTGEFNRGTYGLATGATGMMGAANPRLEAMYNAQRQQDLQAAANATQGGMDYAKFGAGLVGTGGNMLRDMYGTQSAAYSPFATAMTGAQNIEGLGQNALDMSVNIGKTASPAQSGALLGQGMLGAAQTMQQANAYSPWGTALMNAGNALGSMQQPQQQQATYDPTRFQLVPFGT